jgi:hypothetical protein
MRIKVFGLLSSFRPSPYDCFMPLEIARLLLGLLIAACHQRIADFILERDRSLLLSSRQRGVPLPATLRIETARNLYFGVGIFVVLVELLRICQLAH